MVGTGIVDVVDVIKIDSSQLYDCFIIVRQILLVNNCAITKYFKGNSKKVHIFNMRSSHLASFPMRAR